MEFDRANFPLGSGHHHKEVRDRAPVIRSIPFVIRTVSESSMFGAKQILHGSYKIQISDPTRTTVDLLDAPKLGGWDCLGK